MRTLAIAMLAGVSALAATTAARADEITTSGVQQVRLVCNDYGRCWHEPSDRVIIRRNFYPEDRYYHRYYHRDYGPGFGINAPGVHIGVGEY